MFRTVIHKQAKKKLLSLSPATRIRIAEEIQRLGKDPDDVRLDIKKMHGMSGYRLRVGEWRIIFDRNDKLRIISIDKIGPRGDVYK